MPTDAHTHPKPSRERSSSFAMYRSLTLAAFFTSCVQRLTTAQFTGTLSSIHGETDGILEVLIENTSTGNYSIEARNNLFDDVNPYQPLAVKNLVGTNMVLVGSQAVYGPLSDAAFITMSPGAVWRRTLNMTEYMLPDPTLLKPSSECFTIRFPDGIFAVNTTAFVANEDLATGFLKGASAEIFVTATPLHMNITIMPGKLPAAVAATATVGAQLAGELVQGTATGGLGGAAPTVGASIDSYTLGSTSLFAKKPDHAN